MVLEIPVLAKALVALTAVVRPLVVVDAQVHLDNNNRIKIKLIELFMETNLYLNFLQTLTEDVIVQN